MFILISMNRGKRSQASSTQAFNTLSVSRSFQRPFKLDLESAYQLVRGFIHGSPRERLDSHSKSLKICTRLITEPEPLFIEKSSESDHNLRFPVLFQQRSATVPSGPIQSRIGQTAHPYDVPHLGEATAAPDNSEADAHRW